MLLLRLLTFQLYMPDQQVSHGVTESARNLPKTIKPRHDRLFLRPRSCVKVEVADLGSVPSSLYGLCGRKATLNSNYSTLFDQILNLMQPAWRADV